MKRYVILISGRGSNMEALLDAALPGVCAAVISNRPDAAGLAAAGSRGVATRVDRPSRLCVARGVRCRAGRRDRAHAPDLVLLAGFMRILTDGFVDRFAGRLLNIHPSLLPAFPGIGTHARALEAGVRLHGCSVHFVTPALDGGPIVAQAAVPVLAGDDEASLGRRVLAEEHRLFPRVARWFLEERLHLVGARVQLAGETAVGGALHVPHAL
ncbi:MAG: phosphoribosylglycinamide formyltransferase [Sulfuritalea sp.]|nr:phosphoribosylglycinamide formyltransferase [Sulfuritalea sp.]